MSWCFLSSRIEHTERTETATSLHGAASAVQSPRRSIRCRGAFYHLVQRTPRTQKPQRHCMALQAQCNLRAGAYDVEVLFIVSRRAHGVHRGGLLIDVRR